VNTAILTDSRDTSVPADPGTVDLADPLTFAERDLTEFWRGLRDTRPVHWNPGRNGRTGFWVLSRYDDIMAVYRDNVAFTSDAGNVLVTLLAGGDSAAGKMLAVTDVPRHRELRKILLRAFSPRSLNRVSEQVRPNTRELVGEAVERGECDFATEIASRIPMTTISDLLAVPEADRDFLLRQTKLALSADEEGVSELDSAMARNEILLYFGDLVDERRDNPGEDVISVLAGSTIDGEPLSPDEIVLNCYSLIIGGDETSRLSMIDGVRTLAGHPEQWRRLKNGEVDLDTAVDEVLRWATPTMHFGRTAVTDVTIGDTRIKAGDILTLWHSSGNRDERVFPEPTTFDLARTPNKRMTSGYGPHSCLGSFLAKVEVAELLSALVDFTRGFALTGPALPIHSNFLTGFASLPVGFEPENR